MEFKSGMRFVNALSINLSLNLSKLRRNLEYVGGIWIGALYKWEQFRNNSRIGLSLVSVEKFSTETAKSIVEYFIAYPWRYAN